MLCAGAPTPPSALIDRLLAAPRAGALPPPLLLLAVVLTGVPRCPRLRSQRQAEAKEAKLRARADKAAAEAQEAMAEARARAELDEQDWVRFEQDAAGGTEGAEGKPPEVAAETTLTLTQSQQGQDPKPVQHGAQVLDGQDAHAAAVDFCLEHGMHSAEQVHSVAELLHKQIEVRPLSTRRQIPTLRSIILRIEH